MSDTVVDRLVAVIGFRVDENSKRTAMAAYAGVVAAVGTATAAAIGFTIAQAEADDQLAKTSAQLGMTTESYTALAFAMGQGGVAGEQLDSSLRGLQSQLEAAARGGGEAKAWLDSLGVSARDAEGGVRLAADVLPELADGFEMMSEGDRASASLRLFGESGAAMGLALSAGRESMEALMRQAREMGITLDDVSARQATQLTDSMHTLSAVTRGVGRDFTREFSPALTDAVDGLTRFMAAEDGIVRLTARFTGQKLADTFRFLGTDAGLATAGVIGFGAAVSAPALVQKIPALTGLLTALGIPVTAISGTTVMAGLAVTGLALALQDLYVASQGGDSVIMDFADSVGYATELTDALDASTRTATEAQKALAAAADATSAIFESWYDSTEPARDMQWDLANGAWEASKAIGSVALPFEVFNAAVTSGLANLRDFVGLFTDLEATARGYRKLAAFMRSDDGSMGDLGAALGGVAMSGINAGALRTAQTMGQGLERQIMATPENLASLGATLSGARPAAPIISPTVTVNAGPDAEEVARIAGREVERTVYNGLAASRTP